MKVTKKAKRVSIIFVQIKSEYSKYDCPTCHTKFIGAGIKRNIIRFKCDCGQELIIDKILNE